MDNVTTRRARPSESAPPAAGPLSPRSRDNSPDSDKNKQQEEEEDYDDDAPTRDELTSLQKEMALIGERAQRQNAKIGHMATRGDLDALASQVTSTNTRLEKMATHFDSMMKSLATLTQSVKDLNTVGGVAHQNSSGPGQAPPTRPKGKARAQSEDEFRSRHLRQPTVETIHSGDDSGLDPEHVALAGMPIAKAKDIGCFKPSDGKDLRPLYHDRGELVFQDVELFIAKFERTLHTKHVTPDTLIDCLRGSALVWFDSLSDVRRTRLERDWTLKIWADRLRSKFGLSAADALATLTSMRYTKQMAASGVALSEWLSALQSAGKSLEYTEDQLKPFIWRNIYDEVLIWFSDCQKYSLDALHDVFDERQHLVTSALSRGSNQRALTSTTSTNPFQSRDRAYPSQQSKPTQYPRASSDSTPASQQRLIGWKEGNKAYFVDEDRPIWDNTSSVYHADASPGQPITSEQFDDCVRRACNDVWQAKDPWHRPAHVLYDTWRVNRLKETARVARAARDNPEEELAYAHFLEVDQ